jgi:saccharopine dehydrogenase-like NADP-dependent oxidoreductase
MRVAVLGGYGVFGFKVATLLMRDGVDVVIVGRSKAKAQRAASLLGCDFLDVDIFEDFERVIVTGASLVINCAGPFHEESEKTLDLARLCIKEGVHWFDLAESADFVERITVLDDDAKTAGVKVLSGVSSVPALSSIVVKHLSEGMHEIEALDHAIVPGNQAPRGLAVMEGILEQMGRCLRVLQKGKMRRVWTDKVKVDLGQGIERDAYLIEVPDTRLFFSFFRVEKVRFRAGLDLKMFNVGLWWISLLRRFVFFKWRSWMLKSVHWMANQTVAWGSDKGGMHVRVRGRDEGGLVERSWALVAEDGEGPFVPAVMSRALLRELSALAPGARPAMCETSLQNAKDAMKDLKVSFEEDENRVRQGPAGFGQEYDVFEKGLGSLWPHLSDAHKASHQFWEEKRFAGTSKVEHGKGFLPILIRKVFGFPDESHRLPIHLVKRRIGGKEIWTRTFGVKNFTSHLKARRREEGVPGVVERFGAFSFDIDFRMENERLIFDVKRARFLGVPWPKMLCPESGAEEWGEKDYVNFDVWIKAPLTGQLVVRYTGRVRSVSGKAENSTAGDA